MSFAFLLPLFLAGCASWMTSQDRVEAEIEELSAGRDWVLDYRAQAKYGNSRLRVFVSGERLLREERCCPKRAHLTVLSPLDAADVRDLRESLKLVRKAPRRSRVVALEDVRSGWLKLRSDGQEITVKNLRERDKISGSLEVYESEVADVLEDEVSSAVSWTLPD